MCDAIIFVSIDRSNIDVKLQAPDVRVGITLPCTQLGYEIRWAVVRIFSVPLDGNLIAALIRVCVVFDPVIAKRREEEILVHSMKSQEDISQRRTVDEIYSAYLWLKPMK